MTLDYTSALKEVIRRLVGIGEMPRHIELSKVGRRYWCSAYDDPGPGSISEKVFTGMADYKELAVLKALSERAERLAFWDGAKVDQESCRTERSDGFAALPHFYAAPERLRDIAFNEALERFVWASWWDDESLKFERRLLDGRLLDGSGLDTLRQIQLEAEVRNIYVITPMVEGVPDKVVTILFGELNSGGFISGGASGETANPSETVMRGLDELFRHGMALKKLNASRHEHLSFYEKRLAYFGNGQGSALVFKRLFATGANALSLPSLTIDEGVPSRFTDVFDVHRCYFENQPPFVGGRMERLCL